MTEYDKRILRTTVKVSDDPQMVPYGHVVLFGRSNANRTVGMERFLDVWVETRTPPDWPEDGGPTPKMSVAVAGTGQAVPHTWEWLASFHDDVSTGVWHLYRVRTT